MTESLLSTISSEGAEAKKQAEAEARVDDAVSQLRALPPVQPRHVLIFHRTEGYVHRAIPLANHALQAMGEQTGAFTFETSEDMSLFDAANLERFDAIILNSTVKLSFDDPARRESLLEFVRSGKGLVGIHAATDNFFDFPEAEAMIGGLFDGHPWVAKGSWAIQIEEPDHPLCRHFKDRAFRVNDEIYQFKGSYSRKNQRVLISMDMDDQINRAAPKIRHDDVGISWIKPYGAGRVFYCSLGHNDAIYWDPEILQHYLSGIQYALGDLEADDSPTGAVE